MYNKILAPLDGSKLSECTLDHVKDIATGCHIGKVVLLSVLENVRMPSEWWTNREQIAEMSAETEKKEQQMQENAQAYLSGVGENLKKAGLEVETVILKEVAIHEEARNILEYANENQIDLIVMSTHGRSGPARWAFGSVADRVVRHAKCPVLTVTPTSCRIAL